MVAETAGEAARAGLVVDARVGDAMAPDLAGESYDIVASSLVLFFLPDPLVALRAWRGLLVVGGRIGVSTFGSYDTRWAERVDSVLRAHTPQQSTDARATPPRAVRFRRRDGDASGRCRLPRGTHRDRDGVTSLRGCRALVPVVDVGRATPVLGGPPRR